MSKGRLILFLAFALVFSSTQCAALCVVTSCDDAGSVPADNSPCHHQHNSPDNQAPVPCPHQVVQADVPQSVHGTLAPLHNIGVLDTLAGLETGFTSLSSSLIETYDTSPPGPHFSPGSSILRI
ncbi:MAG: hypothetical protein ACRD4Y_00750 [Candidatus Acidiferrales bacterium]